MPLPKAPSRPADILEVEVTIHPVEYRTTEQQRHHYLDASVRYPSCFHNSMQIYIISAVTQNILIYFKVFRRAGRHASHGGKGMGKEQK